MGTRKRSCKSSCQSSAEQNTIRSTTLSDEKHKSTRKAIKKSGRTKTSSMARQSMGKKWTLQEETRLLALFIAIGPDWSKISNYLEDRQPSTIKCKLNNMLRYALVGANDRIDDVGKFTKRIASEIKSKSYTLFQYHSQHLSKLPLAKIEPFLREELNVILPQIKSQLKREAAERRVATNNVRKNTEIPNVYQSSQLFPTSQHLQSMSTSDSGNLPLPPNIHQPLFNATFPYHHTCSDPTIQWRPFSYDHRSFYQPSLSETPFKFQSGMEQLSPFYPPFPINGIRSTPMSALSSLDPPYNNEICGYSLKVY